MKKAKLIVLQCWLVHIQSLDILLNLRENFYIPIAIHLACFGFFLIAVLPVGYSFAVDLTHPISESMTTGFVMTFATIWGSFFSYLSAYILDIELKDSE